MPLTLELFDEKLTIGRMVIERGNLMIQFLPKDRSLKEIDQALFLRKQFMLDIPRMKLSSLSNFKFDTDIDDPLHKIIDHMCESDTEAYHVHFEFNKDIDCRIMQEILSRESMWLDHVSEDCYLYLCDTATHYFFELNNSASAQSVEKEYKADKRHQLELEIQLIESQAQQSESFVSQRQEVTLNASNFTDAQNEFIHGNLPRIGWNPSGFFSIPLPPPESPKYDDRKDLINVGVDLSTEDDDSIYTY